MIRISITYHPICFPFTGIFRKNGKHAGGYVIEILIIIPRCGRGVSTQFLVFPISTRVEITVYQHGKFFIFLNSFLHLHIRKILAPVDV